MGTGARRDKLLMITLLMFGVTMVAFASVDLSGRLPYLGTVTSRIVGFCLYAAASGSAVVLAVKRSGRKRLAAVLLILIYILLLPLLPWDIFTRWHIYWRHR